MTEEILYPRGIEVIVGPYILNQQNQVLLAKSPKYQSRIICGGHVEPGEKLEAACIRETKEELGIDINIIGFLRFFDEFVQPPVFKRHAHFIFFDYIARSETSEFCHNDEISEHSWFDIDEAINLPDVKASVHDGLILLKQWLIENNNQI